MYFTLFSMMLGAVQGVMALSESGHGVDWFDGASKNASEKYVATSVRNTTADMKGSVQYENSDVMNPSDGQMLTADGTNAKSIGALTVVYTMFRSILSAPSTINAKLYVPVTTTGFEEDPVTHHMTEVSTETNGFGFFSYVIEFGLYAVYILGMLQIFLKFQLKYAQ